MASVTSGSGRPLRRRADQSWPQRGQLYQATTQLLSAAGATGRPHNGHAMEAVTGRTSMHGTWATIVPAEAAAVQPRVTKVAGRAPKISDGDAKNFAVEPRTSVTSSGCELPDQWPPACNQRGNMSRVVVGIVLVSVIMFPNGGRAQTARTAAPALALESLTGRDSFDRYCAACHGADGRGAGPVASALKSRPADLTTLAERNGGSFPRERIASFVEGTGRPLPAHGTSDMPVWGTTFRGLESSDVRVKVRLANLVAYVESLQRPAGSLPRDSMPRQTNGAQLFRTYCASCHGETAQGSGPLSAQLTRPVPDLTTYTARNGGVFPGERLRQIIAGRGPAAHGDRTMPVWGEMFRRQESAPDAEGARIDALVGFLQSIQQRGAE